MDIPNENVIYDVSESNFIEKVIEVSSEKTVVVDFWAAWCAPCKMLGPLLENIVRSYDGKVALAKVDVDSNGSLAVQFGVRSIPTVKIIRDGAVVQEFVGALPEADVRALLDPLVGGESGETLEKAKRLVLDGRLEEAAGIYNAVLEENPGNAQAFIGLARIELQNGNVPRASELLGKVDEIADDYNEARNLLAGIEFLTICNGAGNIGELERRITDYPDDLDAAYSLGCCFAASGKYSDALDAFLSIVRKNREYGDDKAKEAMVTIFGILGPENETTRAYRQHLANLLF